MKMKMQRMFLVAILFYLVNTKLVKGQLPKNCKTSCGNVSIEYPFGTSPGCYYGEDPSFKLTCDEKETLLFGNMPVINMSQSGQLRLMLNSSFSCYLTVGIFYDYTLGNLSLSTTNKFTLVGCNAYSNLTLPGTQSTYSTGCMSLCDSLPKLNKKCNGEGCCQTDVSVRLDSLQFRISSSRFPNGTYVNSFNPCIYAFLVEDGHFNFSSTEDLMNMRNVTKFPVVLDWSIGRQTCEEVGNRSICSQNSNCFNSIRETGYNCNCTAGFEGNPYLLDGCKDINECNSTTKRHNCSDAKTCSNYPGGFECKCKSGYHLDYTDMSCKRKNIGWAIIFLGTTIGFLVLLLAFTSINQRFKSQKDTKLRQYFFEQNGGGKLRQRLSGGGSSKVDVQIFTEESMKIATNGYEENRILGQGGQGTVYQGILPDNSIVAIKKARLGDSSQVEQFINEVVVLSQINHRNVVKLLGCCLETEIPLLVYEFITSGTLFDHLHSSMFDSSLTWDHRLRIAIEVAGTLAYLHSSASIPIIHRDVKTANILLDENLTAKVADFGASRLIPTDKEELATMVQGTLGYLDPEYYNTGLLNEKSDVYSFGVVLMELISGEKALCFERQQQSKHIVSYFASAIKENRLQEVIDGQVMNEYNKKEIERAVIIALECTRLLGEGRPKMKEVVAELEALRVTTTKHKWSDQYPEEIEHLVGHKILSKECETSSIGYDSVKNVARLDMETGR